MLQLTDYIKTYENIIDLEECKKIIEKDPFNFEKATIGDDKLNESRNCYIKVLEKEFEKSIYNAVGKMIVNYKNDNPHFTLGLSCEDTGYQHLLYKGVEKGEYKTHVDHYDLQPRVLSCSFILNDNYEGGNFSFFEGKHIVKKKEGSVVVFPSNFCFPHAITPVTNGDRHAIITWLR